MTNTFFET